MRLQASEREFAKGFRRNLDGANAIAASPRRRGATRHDEAPELLLRFYAAECGLKAVVAREQGLSAADRGHDLRALWKDARFPRAASPVAPQSVRLEARAETRDLCEAHQALRYGVSLDERSQEEVRAWLSDVCERCRQAL